MPVSIIKKEQSDPGAFGLSIGHTEDELLHTGSISQPTQEVKQNFSAVNSTQLALENPDVYDEIQVTFDEILQKTKGKDLEAALLKMYERSGRKIDRLIEDRRNAIKNYSDWWTISTKNWRVRCIMRSASYRQNQTEIPL